MKFTVYVSKYATYSKLLPNNLWTIPLILVFKDVCEKLSIILGTFIFAVLIDNYSAIWEFLNDFSVKLPTTSGWDLPHFQWQFSLWLASNSLIDFERKKIESKQEH